MMTLAAGLILIFVSLVASFFFSGSETAVVSASRYRLRHLKSEGNIQAGKTLDLLDRSPRVMSAVLIGTNLGNVFAVLLFKSMLEDVWPGTRESVLGILSRSDLISLVLLTSLIVVFAEILPKALFRARADAWIMSLQPVLTFFTNLFSPVIYVLEKLVDVALLATGSPEGSAKPRLTRSDLLMMLRGGGAGPEPEGESTASAQDGRSATNGEAIPPEQHLAIRVPDERRVVRNIIGLDQHFAREIMQPLVEIEAVPLGRTTIEAFLQQARRSGHSRFPVYRDRIVDLTGYINVYDVIRDTEGRVDLEDFVHPAHYVPETQRVDDLLQEFLFLQISNAIVVDEYGGCSGWVTREDVIEEIVGELEDELDRPVTEIEEREDGSYLIEGRSDIDDVNEILGTKLDKTDCDTIGGLMMRELGKIPREGDAIEIQGWGFRIDVMDGMRVGRIEILPRASDGDSAISS